MVQEPHVPSSNKDEISHQLERMLTSSDFHATPQQVALLKFVVNQTLAGKASEINGYTVATQAFGRSDYDQSSDSIVSIQAGKLRHALTRYYEIAGKSDPIRIDIPKGTYVPVFEKRPHAHPPDTASYDKYPDIFPKSSLPSVLIRPLRNLSGDPDLDFWSIGLTTELADELNRYPDIRVLIWVPGSQNTAFYEQGVRFIVDGSVRSDGTSIKLILNLTDTRTGYQIWSESSRSSIEATSLIALQEALARSIAVKIAGERGLIMKTLDKESKRRPPACSTVYEAVLRYIDYDMNLSRETFSPALAALEKAVIIDPEYGPAWSMLARLYADIYTLDIPGFKDPVKKAFESAQNGTRLSPNDQRCSTIMAYIHFVRNDLTAGLAEAKRALRLGPETLFFLDGLGFLMTLMGDFEQGPALIKKVMKLNPFYGNYVHFSLWVNCLQHNDYAGAFQESLRFNAPKLFLVHVARASTLGLLGRIEEGCKSAAELLKLKPDFAERGRILIRHYIKFEDIEERIAKGLNAVSVAVK